MIGLFFATAIVAVGALLIGEHDWVMRIVLVVGAIATLQAGYLAGSLTLARKAEENASADAAPQGAHAPDWIARHKPDISRL